MDQPDYPPGEYDIPYQEYERIPYPRGSALKAARISARHLYYALNGQLSADSPSKLFGRAVHAALLEPETFAARYTVAGTCGATLASGKRKGEVCGAVACKRHNLTWYCRQHAPDGAIEVEDALSPEQHETIARIMDSLRAHQAWRMLRSQGGAERTVIADLDGVRIKARLDKVIDNPPTIVDLKTARPGTCHPEQWPVTVARYGYHFSAALYVDALAAVRQLDILPAFVWLVVETDEPYSCWVYQASAECIAEGRRQYQQALSLYRRCMETGNWDLDTDQIYVCDLPKWAVLQE